MTPNEIRFQIMSQVTEDVTGLWELAATTQAPAIDELIQVLAALIQERLVTIYRGTSFTSEETALPASAARNAILDKRFWDWSAPNKGPHLRAFATPRGRDWYFGQRKQATGARLAS
jgi:hypothetical protein